MKKLAVVSFTLFSLFALAVTSRAEGTLIPQGNPGCNGNNCTRWYELTENPDPTACLYVRRDLVRRELANRCGRWYSVGEAPPPPRVEAKKIVIDQMVHFDFNKYNIKSDSYAILDDVANVLQKNPHVKKVRVEGHTDGIGSDSYNQKLSQRRAESVVDYLVKKGVSPSRLEAVGYGKTRPIATNKTAAGRAQNRRVEFNVTEQ
jgi:outer membrane protein OmpA-like peptidoglycan-associated protein